MAARMRERAISDARATGGLGWAQIPFIVFICAMRGFHMTRAPPVWLLSDHLLPGPKVFYDPEYFFRALDAPPGIVPGMVSPFAHADQKCGDHISGHHAQNATGQDAEFRAGSGPGMKNISGR